MIHVEGLTVVDRAGRRVLDGVEVDVAAGTTLGVVGESASGKTTLTLALLGHVRPGLRIAGGEVRVAGVDVLTAPAAQRRALRRRSVAYLGQDPAAALTPTMRVAALVAERLPDGAGAADARRALAAVGLPDGDGFLRRRPRELSGGQRQRLALARALAPGPQVVVLDEPTTGLDVVTQDLVLGELERLRRELDLTVLVVSHDLAVVARLADDVAVLRAGAVVEHGEVIDVLAAPRHPYTRQLVAACPEPLAARPAAAPHATGLTGIHHPRPVLEVSGVRATHRDRRGREVVAAADVSFHLHGGECVALVGASGSGKTTLARAVVGLHRPDAGVIRFDGTPMAALARQRPAAQRGAVQLVPQDPGGSLNPRRTVVDAVARPLRVLHGAGRGAAAEVAAELLERVHLDPAVAARRPAQLSGGERQRVAIARALAARPSVLVCDEITTALDVSVQAAVLDLLGELRRQLGLAVLFIGHDLGVVARVADRVLVLEQGLVCEHGSVAEVLGDPAHDVTRQLVAASPSLSRSLSARAAT